jgi:hypothetical protein
LHFQEPYGSEWLNLKRPKVLLDDCLRRSSPARLTLDVDDHLELLCWKRFDGSGQNPSS